MYSVRATFYVQFCRKEKLPKYTPLNSTGSTVGPIMTFLKIVCSNSEKVKALYNPNNTIAFPDKLSDYNQLNTEIGQKSIVVLKRFLIGKEIVKICSSDTCGQKFLFKILMFMFENVMRLVKLYILDYNQNPGT